jgi:hypothetical protein
MVLIKAKAMNKKNIWLMVGGLLLMVFLLYYLFGSTSKGIYCEAEVLAINEVEDPDFPENETIYDVRLKILAGPFGGQELHADHFHSPGSA